MEHPSNCFIREAIELSRQLTLLADRGEASSDDDRCVVLFSVIRDCAYKIRGRAESEREIRRAMGVWKPTQKPVETAVSV